MALDANYTNPPFALSSDGKLLQGQLNIDSSKTPLRISGVVQAPLLNLQITTAADNSSARIFDDQPIDWSWPAAVDLDLNLLLDQFIVSKVNYRNVRGKLALHDGQLVADPIDASLQQGSARGSVRIQQKGAAAAIGTRITATKLTPEDIGQAHNDLINGGQTDVMLDLRSQGSTEHELAAALDGEIALEIQRATIPNNYFELIGADILLETVRLINPFAKQQKQTQLECGAAYFTAAAGVLTSRDDIVFETTKNEGSWRRHH